MISSLDLGLKDKVAIVAGGESLGNGIGKWSSGFYLIS